MLNSLTQFTTLWWWRNEVEYILRIFGTGRMVSFAAFWIKFVYLVSNSIQLRDIWLRHFFLVQKSLWNLPGPYYQIICTITLHAQLSVKKNWKVLFWVLQVCLIFVFLDRCLCVFHLTWHVIIAINKRYTHCLSAFDVFVSYLLDGLFSYWEIVSKTFMPFAGFENITYEINLVCFSICLVSSADFYWYGRFKFSLQWRRKCFTSFSWIVVCATFT